MSVVAPAAFSFNPNQNLRPVGTTNENFAQDVNQDGYGDIVVGAPGVGIDAGSAYVVFGAAAFSQASYNVGNIGAEGSFHLVAPSDEGYGGYSVAGAGER